MPFISFDTVPDPPTDQTSYTVDREKLADVQRAMQISAVALELADGLPLNAGH